MMLTNSFVFQSAHSQLRTINVTITDSNNAPVNNAVVILTAQQYGAGFRERAVFQRDGIYSVRIPVRLIDMEFDLDISAQTIVPYRGSVYWAGETHLRLVANSVALRDYVLNARDSQGRRVTGAHIVIDPLSERHKYSIPTEHIGNGMYRAKMPETLIGGEFQITGEVRGLEPINIVVSWNGESSYAMVFQERVRDMYRQLTISVTDDKKQPLIGAQPSITVRDAEYSPESVREGNYRFKIPADAVGDNIAIKISADDFQSFTTTRKYDGEEQIEFNLEPISPDITITLLDERNRDIRDANVKIIHENTEYLPNYTFGGDYIFNIPGDLIGDQLVVEAMAQNYEPIRQTYMWGGESTYKVVLEKRPLSEFLLTISDENNIPVENASATLRPVDASDRETMRSTPRGSGRYIFISEHLQYDREFILEVNARNHQPKTTRMTIPEHNRMDITLNRITAVAERDRDTDRGSPPISYGSQKSTGLGTIIAILIPGGGHLYAEETKRGLTILGVSVGGLVGGYALTYSSIKSTGVMEEPNFTYLWLGVAIHFGSWLYGIIDTPKAVDRYNQRSGFSVMDMKLNPYFSHNQEGGFHIGLSAKINL